MGSSPKFKNDGAKSLRLISFIYKNGTYINILRHFCILQG